MIVNSRVLKETSNGISQICVTDELFDSRICFLNSAVDAESMAELIQQFMYLEMQDSSKPIYFYINSNGGSVSDGMALYDLINAIKAPVITVCVGSASSMGAMLFLAGKKRVMFKHSKVMIHDASYGNADFGGLKPDEIKERTNQLVKTCEMLRGIIADKTGHSLQEIEEKMKIDSYFTVEEAIEYGLATDVVEDFEAITL